MGSGVLPDLSAHGSRGGIPYGQDAVYGGIPQDPFAPSHPAGGRRSAPQRQRPPPVGGDPNYAPDHYEYREQHETRGRRQDRGRVSRASRHHDSYDSESPSEYEEEARAVRRNFRERDNERIAKEVAIQMEQAELRKQVLELAQWKQQQQHAASIATKPQAHMPRAANPAFPVPDGFNVLPGNMTNLARNLVPGFPTR